MQEEGRPGCACAEAQKGHALIGEIAMLAIRFALGRSQSGLEFEYVTGEPRQTQYELLAPGVNASRCSLPGREFAYATGARDFIRTKGRAMNNPGASLPDGWHALRA
jgi:hypothetical protein